MAGPLWMKLTWSWCRGWFSTGKATGSATGAATTIASCRGCGLALAELASPLRNK